MYYHSWPIYTIPEYIPRKVQSSSNFYIIDYEEDYTFSDTSACLLFTISICYRYMYANFTSEVGGALRIIMAGHTRVHIQKDEVFFQFFIYRLRRSLHSIPEYIYRKVKASANIYIIEYAEAFIFSDTSACLLFSISICCQYMYDNFTSVVGGALCIIMAGPFILGMIMVQ